MKDLVYDWSGKSNVPLYLPCYLLQTSPLSRHFLSNQFPPLPPCQTLHAHAGWRPKDSVQCYPEILLTVIYVNDMICKPF